MDGGMNLVIGPGEDVDTPGGEVGNVEHPATFVQGNIRRLSADRDNLAKGSAVCLPWDASRTGNPPDREQSQETFPHNILIGGADKFQ